MALFVRSFAVVAAALILTATAHVNIMAHGGYGSTFSYLTGAVAIGIVAGSLVIGQLAVERRPGLAFLFIVAIMAGEATTFINTAERVVESREEKQAPLRAQERMRDRAQARVDVAERALATIPSTTERLRKAEAAKAAADKAVIEKSAERGCATNCRKLLQAQVDAAQDELAAARAELQSRRRAAEANIQSARADLSNITVTATASPLADRLGIEPWQLDVLTSALASTSANGFACLLLIFGAHRKREPVEVVTLERMESSPTPAEPMKLQGPSSPRKRRASAQDHAGRFGIDCFRPGGEADLSEIEQQYKIWCASRGVEPLPNKEIVSALASLFRETGIDVVESEGKMVAVGVSIADPRRKALGHMASIKRQAP